MSRLEIYKVQEDGEVVDLEELRNSFLGFPLVWTELGKKYLQFQHDTSVDWPMTWKLQYGPALTDAEWCTLLTTFDGCIIPREHFGYVAKCFKEFDREFPSHYAKLAQLLSEAACDIAPNGPAAGICFNATSVNSNPWAFSTEDSYRRYNVKTDTTCADGTQHWFFDPTVRDRQEMRLRLPDLVLRQR